MPKFAYNNIKNANIKQIYFKLNYKYYSHFFCKDKVESDSKSQLANKIVNKLTELMIIYQQNLFYIQKLHKKVYHTKIQARNYISDKKNLT